MAQRLAHSKITRKWKTDTGQLMFTGGKGGEVFDALGRGYVDFVMGYGPVIIGHAVEAFTERVRDYLAHGVMMPGYTVFHEDYLDRLLIDRPHDRGAYFKTASEAVTAAMRLSALETGRVGVIRSGYIGWHDAQVANSPRWHEPLHSPLRQELRYTAAMRGVGPQEPALNWIDLELASLADLLDQHAGRLSCFVFDAYLASFTSTEVLRQALAMCRAAGLLTVFDETKTGGRISPLGYAHDHGLDTDLIVIGKSLANGAPLSLLVGDQALLAHAEKARLSGTFSKEMIAVYSALATMDILNRPVADAPDGWAVINAVGRKVADTITAAATAAGVVTDVWARPVLGGGMFELAYSDALLRDRGRRASLTAAFTEAGILLLEGHPSFVCLAHGSTDWHELQQRATAALSQWSTVTGGTNA
jgi:glutamate-1-semialdehyde 2,1-aminomutase